MNLSSNPAPAVAHVYGVATILAPVLLLASTVAFVVAGEGINHGVLGGTIGVWSSFALLVAFIGILRALEPAAPRAAAVLTVLAISGLAAGVAFNVDAIVTAAAGPESSGTFNALVETQPVAILAFLPWGWFVPLSLVLAGIFLWRTRTVPAWNGVLLIAAGVLFVASRPERITLLAIASDVVLIAAMAPIGWAMLRTTTPRGRVSTADLARSR